MPWVKSNLGALVLAVTLQTQNAFAQGDLLGADEMAEAIVAMTSRVWTGPRTPRPPATPRPTSGSVTARSPRAFAAVHADESVDDSKLAAILESLESARARSSALGWPDPISDGALGGGPEFDLYVTSELRNGAYSDGLVPWTYLDRASVFVVLRPAFSESHLEACVTEAYAEAMLLSADPAEASTWRRATAAWWAWELTGRFGCDDAVYDQQAEPHRSWVAGAAGQGAGGALWLAYLSGRHDGEHGRFVRDVWTLASQRTWEGESLRAEPDVWAALEVAIARSGDRLLDNVEDLAVQRWFIGRSRVLRGPLAAIDADAQVPVTRRMTRLPSRVSAPVALQPFGSAYVTVDREALGDATTLHAWLRGEYGVRWSFIVVQLDRDENEIQRLSAPHTAVRPEAYLPIDVDEATTRLLFVVTNLSNGRPDADAPDANERAFELTVDRVR
jgi:hypothetical protein